VAGKAINAAGKKSDGGTAGGLFVGGSGPKPPPALSTAVLGMKPGGKVRERRGRGGGGGAAAASPAGVQEGEGAASPNPSRSIAKQQQQQAGRSRGAAFPGTWGMAVHCCVCAAWPGHWVWSWQQHSAGLQRLTP
jgi:hypothetical protein